MKLEELYNKFVNVNDRTPITISKDNHIVEYKSYNDIDKTIKHFNVRYFPYDTGRLLVILNNKPGGCIIYDSKRILQI